MKVHVSAFGDVERHLKERHEVELPEQAAVSDLLATLSIPKTDQLTVGVNGQAAALDSRLHDGDKVMLVTPMEGGSNAHA